MPHIGRRLCTCATVILLVMILLLNQFGSPLAGLAMEQQVYNHLRSQGYGEEDIADIHVLYTPGERYVYTAEVIFRDHGGYVRCYIYDSEQDIRELERIGKYEKKESV